MKRYNWKIIIGAISYVIGLTGIGVFLSLLENQYGTTAWLYGGE